MWGYACQCLNGGGWCSGALRLGDVDFTFVDLVPGPLVADELRLCARSVESPSSCLIVMKPPVEVRGGERFLLRSSCTVMDRSVLHTAITMVNEPSCGSAPSRRRYPQGLVFNASQAKTDVQGWQKGASSPRSLLWQPRWQAKATYTPEVKVGTLLISPRPQSSLWVNAEKLIG